MSRRRILTVMAAGVLVMPLSTLRTTPGLVWNTSASVPLGLYHIEPGPVRHGDLALVRLPPDVAQLADRRRYLSKSAYLIKFVLAVAGDRVCRRGESILVNGVVVARASTHDRLGRQMPVWRGCRHLASGEFFLLADDPQSFDGRYFGVVSERHVIGRAVLLWPVHGPWLTASSR